MLSRMYKNLVGTRIFFLSSSTEILIMLSNIFQGPNEKSLNYVNMILEHKQLKMYPIM